jgi:hypothetical protein
VNVANEAGVAVELEPPPTATVLLLSKPMPPPVVPPTALAVVLPAEAAVVSQVVTTVNTDGVVLPWQIDTEPEPPAITGKDAGVPPVTVRAGVFGRATIVVDTVVVLLAQVGVTQESV